jgi:hypothetical protein
LLVFEAFLAAARGFLFFAAFLAADFLETDFDVTMFPLQPTTLLPLGLSSKAPGDEAAGMPTGGRAEQLRHALAARSVDGVKFAMSQG